LGWSPVVIQYPMVIKFWDSFKHNLKNVLRLNTHIQAAL